MARCKKSYEDQLKAVEEQIAKVQEKLNHLKEQRENILSKKREEELAELYQVLQENELTDVYKRQTLHRAKRVLWQFLFQEWPMGHTH